jgi:hypothetical protein
MSFVSRPAIENMAIGASIAAKVQDDAFVGCCGALEGGGNVSCGLFLPAVNSSRDSDRRAAFSAHRAN